MKSTLEWTTRWRGVRTASLGSFTIEVRRYASNRYQIEHGAAPVIWMWEATHPHIDRKSALSALTGDEPTEARARSAAEAAVRKFVKAEFTIPEAGA